MKRLLWGVIALATALNSEAFGAVVYSNTTTDTGFDLSYVVNGFTQVGDQIQLAGVDRFGTLATVQFFNAGAAGTFDATLRLFNVGMPVGAQIGSDFILLGIVAPANDVVTAVFSLNVPLPDDLIFTVGIGNQSAGVFIDGLTQFDPPTIGSSNPLFAIANDGVNYLEVVTTNNVYFDLQATSVPEPLTTSMVGSALAGLLLFRRLRRG